MTTDALEAFVQSVPPTGEAVDMPADLTPEPAPEFVSTRSDVQPDLKVVEVAPPAALMDLATFQGQWVLYHQMLGGVVAMRTGAPCPLQEQAATDGGRLAGEAAFDLIRQSPVLSNLILNPQSTFWGSVMVVGGHALACVSIVRESAKGNTLDHEGDPDGD